MLKHLKFPALVTLTLSAGMAFAAPASKPQDKPAAAQQATPPETPAEKQIRAWHILTDGVQDAKHPDMRTQALSALSDLGSNPKANELIAAAMKDPDLDVRSAAALAAGKTKSRTLVPPLRKLLDDQEPQVVFTAASVLWKEFHDHSGEDILDAIVSGKRKANPTLIHGAQHQASKTLHNPAALAKLGVENGAGFFLGPFGFSITAIEYMRKNGTDTARVTALELLAEDKSQNTRDDLMDALTDKDIGVRAAAARLLGKFHEHRYATAIAPLLDDEKLPVRLTAAAGYINCNAAGGAKK
ncbi:HEAT repeat domain-containing protein [Granulicella cerasi]|uniref:HEAT repeat domain-containing protein n=1 Tax=Granulicella cerasi TaxID=741063 RepID=A0ABW1Z6J6_9BACT|nr:HEAT repeat domain-containing protein [Granulicella cerasi]